MAQNARTPDALRLTVLCGNPRQSSRTLTVALGVADRVLETATVGGPVWTRSTVDLAAVGHQMFAPEGVVAVPVTVMAAPTRTLAADVHLRPLLLELGAVVPAGSVVLTEDGLGPQSPDLQRWSALYAQLALRTATAEHHRQRRDRVPSGTGPPTRS